jgi:hypothetical protein
MNDDRLSREQERAMLELLEESALNDYPNPQRIACPGTEFLKQLANNRRSIELSDVRLDHVPRCSPCFREFAYFRDARKRAVMTRRAVLAAAGTLAAGLGVVVLRWPQSDLQSSGYERFEINLYNYSRTRGVDTPNSPASLRTDIPRKRLYLIIILPFASQEGKYEIQILRGNGESTGLSASGTAQLRNGKTSLEIKIDLTSLSPDHYQMGIRRVPFSWIPIPIEIH